MTDYILFAQVTGGLIASGVFGILFKDGIILYKDIIKALEDRRITEDEIDIILNDVGRIFKGIARIFGVFRKL